MNDRLRSGWTRFILSLIHRSPEQVQNSLTLLRDLYPSSNPYMKLITMRVNSPVRFRPLRVFGRHRRPVVGRTWIDLIQKIVDSERVGNLFNSLDWRILSFHKYRTLLTGDRPIIMTNGMNRPDSHLLLPIGPRRLFVAAHNREIADHLENQDADKLISQINDQIVRQLIDSALVTMILSWPSSISASENDAGAFPL